ncbi:MAG: 30S ribosomal protein S5, partial [SAR202 cluster bacterium]|nr:30S ribosomal protein S5 [SAR202 cluster bacterium]
MYERDSEGSSEYQEKVVQIRRVAKVVKGGRHMTFNAMVVVGDGRGRVGAALGKGMAVPDAVRQGTNVARKHLITVPLKGNTIPHAVTSNFGASSVLLKPAPTGAGIIAGGAVRAVMEAVGVKDVVAKALGSRNPINLVKATLAGLSQLKGDRSVAENAAPLPPTMEERRERRREERRGRGGDRGDRGGDRRPRGPRPPAGAPS